MISGQQSASWWDAEALIRRLAADEEEVRRGFWRKLRHRDGAGMRLVLSNELAQAVVGVLHLVDDAAARRKGHSRSRRNFNSG
jgi:hypothetical protein